MSPRARFPLADGHADSLMWNRDLTQRSDQGHVDFPRLQEAGTRIQCFTVVTRGYPFVDGLGLFAAYRGWPSEARRSPWARATFQLDWMDELIRRSNGAVQVAASAAALEENIARGRLSAVMGIEGAQALEGQPERVAELHRRGVRFMSLTHLANNELGGSSSPLQGNRGLTPLGQEMLEAMVAAGMTVDTAHASARTFSDLADHPRARLFSSHTGVSGGKPSWRNLGDDQLRAIAGRGGVVGIIFATIYLGGSALEDVVRHVDHAVRVMGEDGVALGSDFDGMVPLPRGMRDVTDTNRLVDALCARYPDALVEKITWGNWRRFFRETLG
ncbi:MAG TPA: membrane dipeptidase [Myxococcaceae bacterium]|nr:membrane dipeptidase [Myxococcaceae bacterium]